MASLDTSLVNIAPTFGTPLGEVSAVRRVVGIGPPLHFDMPLDWRRRGRGQADFPSTLVNTCEHPLPCGLGWEIPLLDPARGQGSSLFMPLGSPGDTGGSIVEQLLEATSCRKRRPVPDPIGFLRILVLATLRIAVWHRDSDPEQTGVQDRSSSATDPRAVHQGRDPLVPHRVFAGIRHRGSLPARPLFCIHTQSGAT
jgi:hypothetical protein